MRTLQNLLDDIKLRYRHTFTNDQVLVWLNEERRELFQMFDIESTPLSITTIKDTQFYAIPDGLDIEKIKVMTIQINDSDPPDFVELPFVYNDNNKGVPFGPWITVEGDAFFVSVPGGTVDDRVIYIYCNQSADDLTTADLGSEPIPAKLQEVLKLGTLKRIAQSRKDIGMANNYDAEHEQKLGDLLWSQKLNEPEYSQPVNQQPLRQGTNVVQRRTSFISL